MAVSCACKGVRFCRACEEHKFPSKTLQGLGEFVHLTFCSKCLHVYHDDCPHKKRCQSHVGGFSLDGVMVIDEFITEEEESNLIERIDESPWLLSQSGRSKQDYGVKVNFKKKRINFRHFTGLPKYSRYLVERLHQRMRANGGKFRDFFPVELCNLEYLPERGASIVPHLDDTWLWGERLVILNLLSETKITFTLPPESPDSEEEWRKYKKFAESGFNSSNVCPQPAIAVPLPRRSLLIIAGKARYTWFHSINREDITTRRLSLTMRELSDIFMPPHETIKRLGVCQKEDDDDNAGGDDNATGMTENQKLGLELIKIASSYAGVCVAVASGEAAMTFISKAKLNVSQ